MKMKKLLSSILSLAMLSAVASFSTTVNAADELSVSTKIVEFTGTDADFSAAYGFSMSDLESTAKVYTVETTIAGLDASIAATAGRGSALAYNGTAVSFLSLEYKYDSSIIYSDAYGDVPPAGMSNDLGIDLAKSSAGSIYATALSNDAKTFEPYKSAIAAAAIGTYDLSSATFSTILVTNTDDFEIEVEALATVMAIAAGNANANSKVDYEGSNVKYPTGNPVSPTAAVIKPVITGTATGSAVTAGTDSGKIWNGIKIEDVSLGQNYKVKFTDGSDSVTYDLDLNNKEIDGDIDFAVILKSATRNVANVVMEILYDAAN